jgi:hypothetical protein
MRKNGMCRQCATQKAIVAFGLCSNCYMLQYRHGGAEGAGYRNVARGRTQIETGMLTLGLHPARIRYWIGQIAEHDSPALTAFLTEDVPADKPVQDELLTAIAERHDTKTAEIVGEAIMNGTATITGMAAAPAEAKSIPQKVISDRGKTETGQLGPENQKNVPADRPRQKVDDRVVPSLKLAAPPQVLDGGGEVTATAVADRQAQDEPTIVPSGRRSVRSFTVNKGADGEKTVERGYTCKHNGVDCEIAEVFNDATVDLLRTCDGKAIAGVPVRELRYIKPTPNAASKRGKSQEQHAAEQAVALSAGLTAFSPAVAAEAS